MFANIKTFNRLLCIRILNDANYLAILSSWSMGGIPTFVTTTNDQLAA